MKLVFDIEGDGLLETVTTCWCIVAKDIETFEWFRYTPNQVEEGLIKLSEADWLIGHNIVSYDLRALKKLYNWSPNKKTKLFDTLNASRVLWPDRPLPNNKIKGEEYSFKKYGPAHSLGAWGWRFGHLKPEHEDWSRFSEEMFHRCAEDVAINEELLYYLIEKEAKLTVEQILT